MKKVLALVIAFLALAAGLWKLSGAPGFQFMGELVARVDTDRPLVALTFDDGPTQGYTEDILRILDAHGVPATFFLVGSAMEQAPEQAKAIVEAGHEVGNHSWSHQRMVLRSPAFVADEIEWTNEQIRAAGHEGDIHFRPPYGKRLFVLPWYLSREGISTITWDVDPDNGLGRLGNSEEIAAHVVESARPGSIILLHVMFKSRRDALDAVEPIIQGLHDKGFQFVRVSDLLKEAERH